jgi:hypothetical protein
MMNIEKETLDVLIGVAFEQLRHGYPLAERESSALDRLPAIDVFRKSVESKDLDWLLPLVRSAPDVTAGFACSLLRHLIDEPGVAQTMMDRWGVASAYLKNRIMWRLLECDALSLEWREHFLEFVLDNWEVFNEFNRAFYGQADEALARALRRKDESSEQKKWVYWLSLPSVVDSPDDLNELLLGGLQSGDDFSRRAIRAYCGKFGRSIGSS